MEVYCFEDILTNKSQKFQTLIFDHLMTKSIFWCLWKLNWFLLQQILIHINGIRELSGIQRAIHLLEY